jgi:hypothetical protein
MGCLRGTVGRLSHDTRQVPRDTTYWCGQNLEATDRQNCASLGGCQSQRSLWRCHPTPLGVNETQIWVGFPLGQCKNAFNEENWMGMLWTIRHKWPSGVWFTFNCYKHRGTLVLRSKHNWKHDIFLHSKEGITQGDPLSLCLLMALGSYPSSTN